MNEFMGFPKDKVIEDTDIYEFVIIDKDGVETVKQVPRDEVPKEILAKLDIKTAEAKAKIDADLLAKRTADSVNTDYLD